VTSDDFLRRAYLHGHVEGDDLVDVEIHPAADVLLKAGEIELNR